MKKRLSSPPFFARNKALAYRSTRLSGYIQWRLTPELLASTGAIAKRSRADDALERPRAGLTNPLGDGRTLCAAKDKPCRNLLPFERHIDMRRNEAVTNTLPRYTFQPGPDPEAERMRAREPGHAGAFNAMTPAGVRSASRFQPDPACNALAFTGPAAGPHDTGDLRHQKPGPVSHASLRMAH